MAQHAGRVGDLAAYAAAGLAAASAAVSLYWALGGRALLATVGEQFVRLADEGGWVAQAALLAVVAVKLVGAALALALVRPWGRRLPQRLLVWSALAGGPP